MLIIQVKTDAFTYPDYMLSLARNSYLYIFLSEAVTQYTDSINEALALNDISPKL